MQADIQQENGLRLSILRCPSGREGCIVARLTGTNLNAEITTDQYPADSRQEALSEFFTLVAELTEGNTRDWLAQCQDLAINASADALFPGQILLRLYLGSTSDDDCDWQINSSLLATPEQVRRFAQKLAHL